VFPAKRHGEPHLVILRAGLSAPCLATPVTHFVLVLRVTDLALTGKAQVDVRTTVRTLTRRLIVMRSTKNIRSSLESCGSTNLHGANASSVGVNSLLPRGARKQFSDTCTEVCITPKESCECCEQIQFHHITSRRFSYSFGHLPFPQAVPALLNRV
jgi:hypothetical protein